MKKVYFNEQQLKELMESVKEVATQSTLKVLSDHKKSIWEEIKWLLGILGPILLAFLAGFLTLRDEIISIQEGQKNSFKIVQQVEEISQEVGRLAQGFSVTSEVEKQQSNQINEIKQQVKSLESILFQRNLK